MADTDVRTHIDEVGDKAAGAARRQAEAGAGAAKKGADAMTDTAKAGIDAEQRSFTAATDAGRQNAAALGRAAQSSLKASQEMATRATAQAADFWRSSLTPMSQLSGEFNRWFEQMWRGASPASMQGGLPLAMLAPFTGHPLADMRETDRGFELSIDLPGMKAQDIELQVRGEMLIVSGEKNDEASGGQGGYRFSERRFGRFERAFALPPGADRDRIGANFRDGVLKVDIPVSPEGEQAHRIPVRGA
jgi:HSP20 family protein